MIRDKKYLYNRKIIYSIEKKMSKFVIEIER